MCQMLLGVDKLLIHSKEEQHPLGIGASCLQDVGLHAVFKGKLRLQASILLAGHFCLTAS